MSKTDKTRPFHVKLWDDESNIEKVAVHDHRFNDCTLPTSLPEHVASFSVAGCYWEFWYTGVRTCACSMCSENVYYKQLQRRERQKQRKVNLEIRKTFFASGAYAMLDY